MAGYQTLQERRQYQRRMRRRRFMVKGYVAVLIVYIGFILLSFGFVFRSDRYDLFPFATQSPPEDSVYLSFGWGRSSIIRSFSVEIPTTQTPSATDLTELSVRLDGDLSQIDYNGEFPASQILVAANRISPSQLTLTVTANPWSPERVGGGEYRGEIQIRGTSLTINVPIAASLRNRDSAPAVVAFSVITAGAGLGLLVKYITERLTPQAALVRRLSALKRSMAYRDEGATLPVNVRIRVEDLEDKIARSEYAEVEKSFTEFDKDKILLATLSQQFGNLLEQLDRQRESAESSTELTTGDIRLVEAVLESEFRLIQDAQLLEWRPDTQDLINESLHQARSVLDVVGVTIEQFVRSPAPSLRRRLYDYQQGVLPTVEIFSDVNVTEVDVPEKLRSSQTRDEASSKMMRKKEKRLTSIDRFSDPAPISALFRHARGIAALASVVVVSIAGLKTQYLDSQDFSGQLSDWLRLTIWGLVIELSGVSILDVLGRLTNNPVSSTIRNPSN